MHLLIYTKLHFINYLLCSFLSSPGSRSREIDFGIWAATMSVPGLRWWKRFGVGNSKMAIFLGGAWNAVIIKSANVGQGNVVLYLWNLKVCRATAGQQQHRRWCLVDLVWVATNPWFGGHRDHYWHVLLLINVQSVLFLCYLLHGLHGMFFAFVELHSFFLPIDMYLFIPLLIFGWLYSFTHSFVSLLWIFIIELHGT